jgi:hypothetical protein
MPYQAFLRGKCRQPKIITGVWIQHPDSRDVPDTREPLRPGHPGGFDGVPGDAHRAGSACDVVTALIVELRDENMKREPTGATGAAGLCGRG